jgi:hypothetical protein
MEFPILNYLSFSEELLDCGFSNQNLSELREEINEKTTRGTFFALLFMVPSLSIITYDFSRLRDMLYRNGPRRVSTIASTSKSTTAPISPSTLRTEKSRSVEKDRR